MYGVEHCFKGKEHGYFRLQIMKFVICVTSYILKLLFLEKLKETLEKDLKFFVIFTG